MAKRSTAKKPATEQVTFELGKVNLELPFDPRQESQGFAVHLDMQLSGAEAWALRRIYMGLDKSQATTESGGRVTNYPRAIKYILQQLGQQMPGEPEQTEQPQVEPPKPKQAVSDDTLGTFDPERDLA